jgi:Domain of unknown function (DUF4055)
MPVNSHHRQYTGHFDQWVRCRDACGGTDAVKARSIKYLPLLEGHESTTSRGYIGYLSRALFYPAAGRTVAGLAGLVFSKPPTVVGVPKAQQTAFEDVTLTGMSVGAFGLMLCQEVLTVGRAGILIDMPDTPTIGARPYWVVYQAEQILNWRTTRISGAQVLTRVVLAEEIEVAGEDEFESEWKWQYRVLELVNEMYQVTLWKEDPDNHDKFIQGETRVPLRRGFPMPYIPFTFLSATGIEPEVIPPPLLALVDVNYSHYRTSADHEHGAHYTALPTPYVTGHTLPVGETLSIGSGNAWILPNPAAQAGMLEFTGAGLESLANLKEEKRQLMATLGARMLETDKNTAEAAQTVRLRHAGEGSAMSVLADAVGLSLTQSMQHYLFWAGLDEVVSKQATITMNPDVMDDLSSDDIRVLVETWQKGGISKRTLHYNLAWGEWTRPGVTFEEEEAEIEKEKKDLPPPQPIPFPPPAA